MMTPILAAIFCAQTGYSQEEPAPTVKHETATLDRYVLGQMVFQVERVARFEIEEAAVREIRTETIITPTGKRTAGAPAGLGCERWKTLDPDHCSVRAFTQNDGEVFLVTTGRVYWYDLVTDEFQLVEELNSRVSGSLSGVENVFLLTPHRNAPVFIGLLIGHDGAWFTVDLSKQVDLSQPFEVEYLDQSIVFAFSKRKRMTCDLRSHACVLRGFKEPK